MHKVTGEAGEEGIRENSREGARRAEGLSRTTQTAARPRAKVNRPTDVLVAAKRGLFFTGLDPFCVLLQSSTENMAAVIEWWREGDRCPPPAIISSISFPKTDVWFVCTQLIEKDSSSLHSIQQIWLQIKSNLFFYCSIQRKHTAADAASKSSKHVLPQMILATLQLVDELSPLLCIF